MKLNASRRTEKNRMLLTFFRVSFSNHYSNGAITKPNKKMDVHYSFEKKRWCFVWERTEQKALKKFEKLRDIVLEDKALCYKTQGQTIVFKNEIYTLLPNAEKHTQMKPSKVPTTQKTKQKLLFIENSYLYLYMHSKYDYCCNLINYCTCLALLIKQQ